MRRFAVSAVLGLAAIGAACSADAEDYKNEAESFIEEDDGDIAAVTGEVFTDAQCAEPADTKEGTTFDCTATSAAGETWLFRAAVGADNSVIVDPLGAAGDPNQAPGATTTTTTGTTPTT